MSVGRRVAPALIVLFAAAIYAAEPPEPASLRVGKIELSGNKNVPEEELRRGIALRPGVPFRADGLRAARTMLESLYAGRGYLEAAISTRTAARGGKVDLRFLIDEGPRYRFGETRVIGLTDYPPRTVYRETTYDKGDPYDQRELFHTQGRLYHLGLFQDIRISTATAGDRTVDVEIRLRVRPTRTVGGGIGYGSEERQRLTLVYTDRNLFHRAYQLDLSAEYSAIWLQSQAEVSDRYLFGTRTEGRAHASWRHEEREGYELERIRGRVNAARRLWRTVFGDLGYRLQRTIVFNVAPEVGATTPETALTSALEAALAHDNTDDPFFPTRGSRIGLNLQRSGGVLGGDVHLNKMSATAAGYAKLAGPVIGAAQVRTGQAQPFPPSAEVPVFERFFTGGANSIRGYRERGVGPKDGADNPLGGTHWTGATVELRFPLFWKFNGAVFGDGGQVAATQGGARPSEWKYGAGAGIRFVTPVGPLRLDYGYKLNPDPTDPDLWRIHFSLGETF